MVYGSFQRVGIVPVVVINDAKKAASLADALCEGGLPCAEVTFRTSAASESIRIMRDRHPEMLVGAGTVLSEDQADEALRAGAQFIVSPGIESGLVRHCKDIGITVIPGTQTPSDMMLAVRLGLEVVKFFPAEPSGGLGMLKALAAPFTSLRFMPTGGINASNVGDYLAYDRIVACGGSWMVKSSLIDSDDFDSVRRLSVEAAEIVRHFRSI